MTTSKLAQATTVDIVVSCLLPFWGIVVGSIALVKHERKRGVTMLSVSFLVLFVYFLVGLFRPALT